MKRPSLIFHLLALTCALTVPLTGMADLQNTTMNASSAQLSGELKSWHKVTLTFDGPEASETGNRNPFLDYKLSVTFTHQSGRSYVVPGYFAADGNAAITSASSGNKWRAHLAPDAVGEWKWEVSFRQGEKVAVDADAASTAWAPLDGQSGSFVVAETDKGGRDHRGKGRLEYIGEHFLRYAGTGEYFLKAGADAPENLMAYEDFDDTPNKGNRRKSWAPHAGDFDPAASDLLWGPNRDKGKNLLGAIRYLSDKGMNVFSFLTFNVDGDDQNVFPHLFLKDMADYESSTGKAATGTGWNHVHHTRFNVSKMDQWERVFEYGDRMGMYLHFKMMEAENDKKMDEGETGIERKAYTRELIARYGHHLALNWNMGEETHLSSAQHRDWSRYIRETDPYGHLVVLHTHAPQLEMMYAPLLGEDTLTGLSIQTNQPDFSRVHGAVKEWVRRSAASGKKWVVACDEPGDAQHSLVTDAEDPHHDNARKNALWGTIMAGGAGVEWYFGYRHPHSDLTCEDWRSRDAMWDQCRIALKTMEAYRVPFWRLSPTDLPEETDTWLLEGRAELGAAWMVAYFRSGGTTELELPEGSFGYGWVNPRTGEGLTGLLEAGVTQGGKRAFTAPDAQDWVLLVAEGEVPQSALAALPKPVVLSAIADFTIPVDGYAPGYVDRQRRALALDASQHQDVFAAAKATFQGAPGVYDVLIETLTETDGECSYRLLVNGKQVGAFTNPVAKEDYQAARHVWNQIALDTGDTLTVAFNSHSNGKIPENDAFAFARGRWTELVVGPAGTLYGWLPEAAPAEEEEAEAAPAPQAQNAPQSGVVALETLAPRAPQPFVFDFDPSQAERIFEEVGGVVAVEAEHYAKQSHDEIRKWYLTTVDHTPGIEPDGDPNHAEGASGGAYLEILPDTRRNHGEKLVQGVNFSNVPGQLGVLYYPIHFNTPGRYYVWVRCCVTGSEDNGLHVGLNGEWPESGQRMQWIGKHGQWQWDSKQRTNAVHTGVRHQIWLDIEEPGLHTVMFSMREDGFEFDKFWLTREKEMDIPEGFGPPERVK